MQPILMVRIYKQIAKVVQLARRAYRPYKKKIALLTILGLVSGLLEGIGINAIIPLLTFMLNIANPATDMVSVFIQNVFQFFHVPFVPKFLLAFVVLIFVIKAFMMLWLTYIQIGITAEYERETRSKLFSTILHASWPYLLRQKLGNLETALMMDTPASVALLSRVSTSIMIITSIIMYLVVAFSISPLVTVTTLALGIIISVSLYPLMVKVHRISRERAVAYRDTIHHASEHMSGIKTVKAFGVESEAIDRGEGLFDGIKALSIRTQVVENIAAQVVAPIGVIYIAGILSLAFKTPFISLAALPAIFYLIYRIFTYVQQFQSNLQNMSELTPHLERVLHFESEAKRQLESTTGKQPFSFEKELSFSNVSFSYESDRPVLRDTSFSLKKGTMLGIVGPSGSGKTTCVDLILRLLVPSTGTITIDGIDSREIDLIDWRRRVAYVSQDLFLLRDTIRNNIRFYDESLTDEQVWKASEMAHIADFIRECPQGLDTQVGDRGIRLSAGQRQRIVIARAMVREPEMLVLDEATSSLDAESEVYIKSVIEELKGKVSIIAIAHRLSTIMDSDQLVVLSGGTVAEIGAPKELLANTNSYFYKVYMINQ